MDTPLLRVQGFVGTPEESRKSQPHQYLFLNGRYFQSRYLFKAIAKAYARVNNVSFEGAYYRHDIGGRALKELEK